MIQSMRNSIKVCSRKQLQLVMHRPSTLSLQRRSWREKKLRAQSTFLRRLFFCNLNIKAITSSLYLNEWKFVRKNLYSSYFFLIFFRRIGSSCRTRGEWQHDIDLHLPHTARSELRSIVWRLLAGSYSPHCAAISLG